MTDDQRKRDEEAARKRAQEYPYETFDDIWLDGLRHCRETEVKELHDYINEQTGFCVELQEQLRVAVEALEEIKSCPHHDMCSRNGYNTTSRFVANMCDCHVFEADDALQKIEAMKGGA